MSQPVVVRKVNDKPSFRAFFEFPWTLYKDDPYWTPLLLSMRRELLDPHKNPSWAYLEGDYYVAWRGDQPMGTIAAFVNHRHNEFHKEHIAWFGFFETYDDEEVAKALLDTAREWANEHGYDALRGPQSFTTHEETGLLVDGFTYPSMLMPYNPPYYKKLVEAAGFEKTMDLLSFAIDDENFLVQHQANFDRANRVIERLKKRNNAEVRPIDRKNLRRDFELFRDIYNDAWDANWGFTPMTDQELDALIESLVQFFDPELAFFVEVDGNPVGFILGAPDFNQVLHAAYARPGVPEVLTLLRAFWHWKIRPKITAMKVPLMGIKAEYRKLGLDVMLYFAVIGTLFKRNVPYKRVEGGWVLETNHELIGILEKAGMTVDRTHRLYEKKLK